jgi:hypothetical protein
VGKIPGPRPPARDEPGPREIPLPRAPGCSSSPRLTLIERIALLPGGSAWPS